MRVPETPSLPTHARAGSRFGERQTTGQGGRPDVDNRRRGWNSRPDRLLDTSACDSVRNQSSPYGHGIKGRGIRAGDIYYQGTLIFCFRLAPMTSIPPAHLSVLSVGVGVSVINGFGS